LLALLNAFDINTLILLDMEISQKICKLVPYTSGSDNKEAYYIGSTDSDEDGATNGTKRKDDGPHQYQTLFFNFTHRDRTKWDKIHVQKMIYHKPSQIMFIFSNFANGNDFIDSMKKIYQFVPA
jgi:hypothetical protein